MDLSQVRNQVNKYIIKNLESPKPVSIKAITKQILKKALTLKSSTLQSLKSTILENQKFGSEKFSKTSSFKVKKGMYIPQNPLASKAFSELSETRKKINFDERTSSQKRPKYSPKK